MGVVDSLQEMGKQSCMVDEGSTLFLHETEEAGSVYPHIHERRKASFFHVRERRDAERYNRAHRPLRL